MLTKKKDEAIMHYVRQLQFKALKRLWFGCNYRRSVNLQKAMAYRKRILYKKAIAMMFVNKCQNQMRL